MMQYGRLTNEGAPRSRWTLGLVGLICVTLFSAITCGLSLMASQYTAEAVIIDGSLVEKGTGITVGTAKHERPVPYALSAEGALEVKWIQFEDYREEVVSYYRFPATGEPELPGAADHFSYVFATRHGSYMATRNDKGPGFVFTPVYGSEMLTVRGRALLESEVIACSAHGGMTTKA